MIFAPFLRKPLCWLGLCACWHYESAAGAGGQCIHCGKIVGFVDRATLRRYADMADIERDGGL